MVGVPITVRALGGQNHYVDGLAWLPVILWTVSNWSLRPTRRNGGILIAASVFQFLAVHPHVFWITHLGIFIFLVFYPVASDPRKYASRILHWAFLMLLVGMITAPAWLSFLSLVNASSRGLGNPDLVTVGALQPADWLAAILPSRDGFLADIENQLHLSVPVFILAVVGALRVFKFHRLFRALIVSMLVTALLATNWPAGSDVVKNSIPRMASFRLTARLGVWFVLIGILLAAGDWDHRDSRSLRVTSWIGFGIIVIVGAWASFVSEIRWPHVLWTISFSIGTVLLLNQRFKNHQLLVGTALILIILADSSRAWSTLRS